MLIGERIMKERERQGISRRDFANMVIEGNTEKARVQNLWNIERGHTKRFDVRFICDVCRILETTPNYLFYGKE